MDHDGIPITYVAVANFATVSRALLYRDPELRAEIERLRTVTATRMPTPPAAQRASQDSHDQRLENIAVEIAELRKVNQQLRTRLAGILGDQRAETYQAKATPAA